MLKWLWKRKLKKARAIPHPRIEGAYTVDDPRVPEGEPLTFASEERAQMAADKRNEQRRKRK